MERKKSITIGFSKPRGCFKQPISWIIRKFEGSEYSHVYMRLKTSKLKNDLYYHASGTRVKFMNREQFHKENKPMEEHSYKISDTQYYKALDFAIDKVGAPYSIMHLLGLLAIRLASIFGKTIKNPLSKDGYICTKLAAQLIGTVFMKKINKDINSIVLKDIKELLKQGLTQN